MHSRPMLLLGLIFYIARPAAAQIPLYQLSDSESFAATAENPTGEKGKGGTTASNLGPTRKGSPSIAIPAGKTVILADIKGSGCIRHLWITVPPPPKEYREGPNFWRDLVIRMYWDGSKI